MENNKAQRAPKNRSELLDNAAIIRRRLRTGNDPILKSLGLSPAGIRHFYETEYCLDTDEANLLSAATVTLIESYNG